MIYYLYIDESGDFGEGVAAASARLPSRVSLVGGVCSLHAHKIWETRHLQCVDRFEQQRNVRFHYPDDFHCGPLIKREGKTPSATLDRKLRLEFARTVFDNIVIPGQGALFYFVSRNDKRIFAYSRQATYGLNLVAALRCALGELARREQAEPEFKVDELQVVIAQRTIGETLPNADQPVRPGDNQPYSADLMAFLRAQALFGMDGGAQLARRLTSSGGWHLRIVPDRREAGLLAVDFFCNHVWRDPSLDRHALVTSPDEAIFGNFEEVCRRQLQHFLDGGQMAAASAFLLQNFPLSHGVTASFEPILTQLGAESDPAVLSRELPALLSFCRYLIERRTQESGALAVARAILEALVGIARQVLLQTNPSNPMLQREWAGLLVEGLTDLSACVNHQGATVGQAAIQSELDAALNCYAGMLPHTYAQRGELQLEARNRNLNRLFNDYSFIEVIDDFEQVALERAKQIPVGVSDELLGRMQGSIGQAYAFQSRLEPDWSEEARRWLELSIRHFLTGTFAHGVSVNYLVTLAWQTGDLAGACQEMSRHARLRPVASPTDLAARLDDYLAQPEASAFDIVNYLRIAALGAENGVALQAEALRASVARLEIGLLAEHLRLPG